MSSLFLVLFAIFCQFQFLSICFVYTRVIIGFSAVLTLHCDYDSSSFFFSHKNKVIIINKGILNDGWWLLLIWLQGDSNSRPRPYERRALTSWATEPYIISLVLMTPNRRGNQLSYITNWIINLFVLLS